MTIALRMPALSPTMEEGTLAKWLASEGDAVQAGDLLAEIETDKATMEIEAVDEGVLGRILVGDGTEGVGVGSVIAIILEEGEGDAELEAAVAAAGSAETTKPAEAPKLPAPPQAAPEPAPATVAPPAPASPTAASAGRIMASPLARRMAAEAGIALEGVSGSGPHGRIVKRDIEAAPAAGGTAVAQPSLGSPAVAGDNPFVEERLSTMRKVIAKRMTEAKTTVPHFYLTLDVEIDKLLKLRKELNEELSEGKVSVNDFIIRAVALALRKVPEANVQYAGEVRHRFERADVSVAVAIEGGLVTPIVSDASNKSVVQISLEMKDLAERARAGKLSPEEYQGGTISISNLGMYGIREFSAVINPPQAAILAIGKGEERPIVRFGAVQIATLMTVTLSADHRAIDGAIGAVLLNAFKDYMEAPLTMLI